MHAEMRRRHIGAEITGNNIGGEMRCDGNTVIFLLR